MSGSTIRVTGDCEHLLAEAQAHCTEDLSAMLAAVAHAEGLMLDWQLAWLYALARPYDGAPILEIGTYKGKSALVMAMACPRSAVVTLTIHSPEAAGAALVLAGRQVAIRIVKSWDYLAAYTGPDLSVVYVDGDHNQLTRDLPWFNRLTVGGLLLLHDWSPVGSPPVQACYRAIGEFSAKLGRPPDVRIVDTRQVGMCGFYRREGETA